MTDIENTKYITVKRGANGEIGIFVGGKPATHYYEQKICYPEGVKEDFAWMQKLNPEIEEFHIKSSKTRGVYAKSGNPSEEPGRYSWCCIKLKNGFEGGWVFHSDLGSSALCASYCALSCGNNVRIYAVFRSALFGSVEPVELNGYEIIVKKIKQDIKTKAK